MLPKVSVAAGLNSVVIGGGDEPADFATFTARTRLFLTVLPKLLRKISLVLSI